MDWSNPLDSVHSSHEIIVAIYIDDITIFGKATSLRHDLKESIKKEFAFSDLGPLNWLLGIQIQWQPDQQSVTLSQRAYIDQLLVKFHVWIPTNAWILQKVILILLIPRLTAK